MKIGNQNLKFGLGMVPGLFALVCSVFLFGHKIAVVRYLFLSGSACCSAVCFYRALPR